MLVKSALHATMLKSWCAFLTKIAIFANWLMWAATMMHRTATKEAGAFIVAIVAATNIVGTVAIVIATHLTATLIVATNTKEDGAWVVAIDVATNIVATTVLRSKRHGTHKVAAV